MTLAVTIPRELWMSANRPIANRGMKARKVRSIQALTRAAARTQRLEPVSGAVVAVWTVRYPKGVRMDKGEATNALPVTKAMMDALVPEWLEDDGPKFVVEERFRRGPNLPVPAIHCVSLELTPRSSLFGP